MPLKDQYIPEIQRRIDTSPYSQRLRDTIRAARYKPPWMSNKEWGQLLGPDVRSVLDHMQWTGKLGRKLAIQSLSEPDEVFIVSVAAETHDVPEALKGDISFDQKTLGDDEEEARLYREMMEEIGVIDVVGEKPVRAIAETILSPSAKRREPLGQFFAAVERAGYIRTAIKAASKLRSVDEKITPYLQWLIQNTLSNQTLPVLKDAEKYPLASSLLTTYSGNISSAFTRVPISVFEFYDSEAERSRQLENFLRAQTAWKSSPYHSAKTK